MVLARPNENLLKYCPTWAKRLLSKSNSDVVGGLSMYPTCVVGEPYKGNHEYKQQGSKIYCANCYDFAEKIGNLADRHYKNMPILKQKVIAVGNRFADHYSKVHDKIVRAKQ